MKYIPYGAIAMVTLADKLSCGLQQLMSGTRKFNLNEFPVMRYSLETEKPKQKQKYHLSLMLRINLQRKFSKDNYY